MSKFWPPELWKNPFLLFSASRLQSQPSGSNTRVRWVRIHRSEKMGMILTHNIMEFLYHFWFVRKGPRHFSTSVGFLHLKYHFRSFQTLAILGVASWLNPHLPELSLPSSVGVSDAGVAFPGSWSASWGLAYECCRVSIPVKSAFRKFSGSSKMAQLARGSWGWPNQVPSAARLETAEIYPHISGGQSPKSGVSRVGSLSRVWENSVPSFSPGFRWLPAVHVAWLVDTAPELCFCLHSSLSPPLLGRYPVEFRTLPRPYDLIVLLSWHLWKILFPN